MEGRGTRDRSRSYGYGSWVYNTLCCAVETGTGYWISLSLIYTPPPHTYLLSLSPSFLSVASSAPFIPLAMVADCDSSPCAQAGHRPFHYAFVRPFPPPALENVPLPYILDQLHNLAVNYWDKPHTADCTISMFLSFACCEQGTWLIMILTRPL